MNDLKALLFARWLSMCYADTHLDSKMRCEHDMGFDQSDATSCLNRETGHWFKEQLDHFNTTVWPNYIENGTVDSHKELFENLED
jgi:hypothetical protein